jgi:hypothetical protein
MDLGELLRRTAASFEQTVGQHLVARAITTRKMMDD